MLLPETTASGQQIAPLLREALAFDAPYVVERLLKDRVVDSRAEGEQLFTEIKRYLVLTELTRDTTLGMYSARVDEAWHAFILFTTEYIDFGMRFFGRYLTHAPNATPARCADPEPLDAQAESTFEDFRRQYEACFEEALPEVWYDMGTIVATRRMFNDSVGTIRLVRDADRVRLLTESGELVLSAQLLVGDALEFVTRTGAFYVRELPGGLTDEEKVTLARMLTSAGVLRVAP
ncbi:hypothetical protein [Nocardia neocaledoniensis]|uniref:hypothetical protein n=1 Tax=Nocardia neocaledoniensis TaxID=236511 RepID=UPI0024580368|nr:hypothetical protein [Nocardia neocaledoniensis]